MHRPDLFLQMDKWKTGVAGLVALIFYLFLIPPFWPRPKIDFFFPREISPHQDAEVHVAVSAWHPNFELQSANAVFEADPLQSGATPYHKSVLHRSPERQVWPFWDSNRLTWPRQRVFSLSLPMKELSEKGLLREKLKGSITAVIQYASLTQSSRIPWGGYIPHRVHKKEAFEIKIGNAQESQ